MRPGSGAHRALYWRIDPEHEAFRGLALRSALRLTLVLVAIVAALWLTTWSSAQAQPPAGQDGAMTAAAAAWVPLGTQA